MKAGKMRIAAIVFLLFMVLGFVLNRVANGQYALNPHFVNDIILGIAVIWALCYAVFFYKARANKKKEIKNNSVS